MLIYDHSLHVQPIQTLSMRLAKSHYKTCLFVVYSRLPRVAIYQLSIGVRPRKVTAKSHIPSLYEPKKSIESKS